MAESTKKPSLADADQVLKFAFSDDDRTIGTTGFVNGKVGNKIVRSLSNSNTEQYAYYDTDLLLYTIEVEYTDATLETLVRVERIG